MNKIKKIIGKAISTLIKRRRYRVCELEAAALKSESNISFESIAYYDKSFYVRRIIGYVSNESGRIRIRWSGKGRAYIHAMRTPEFDIKL